MSGPTWHRRDCPGGCGRAIGPMSAMCGECAAKEARANQERVEAAARAAAAEEAFIIEWVAEGIAAIEHRLGRYAEFAEYLAHR